MLGRPYHVKGFVIHGDKRGRTIGFPTAHKISIIEDLGVDFLYVVTFTPEFASLSPEEFIDQYILGFHVTHVVAGFDFTFGKFGKGTMENFQEYREDFPTSVMALGYFDGVHLGHQQVILTAKNTAAREGVKTSVMTFHPHPSAVLKKGREPKDLITPLQGSFSHLTSEDRIAVFTEAGRCTAVYYPHPTKTGLLKPAKVLVQKSEQ
ncbi:hypothetical protein DT075_26025 [Bacillus licheniformis]|nr:hypothetical protein DT075_26025 [Bacillus licheniformis]